MSGEPRTLSVVIPTYLRPEWIRRAVQSLAAQRRPPDEVILVARKDDTQTLSAIDALISGSFPFRIVRGLVAKPGFMPPVQEGFRLALGEVVAVMDDDAEAEPGWSEGILRHYTDPHVGGVGGRCINMRGDEVEPVGSTRRVGYVDALGRFVGQMFLRPEFDTPVDVQFLIGGCMSYRGSVARALEFDEALNGNVAFGYEVDLGLQVRRAGWRIVFDPAVAIRHYSAPRAVAGMRTSNSEAARSYAYNHLRVILRRLSPARRTVAAAWQVLAGERRAPGLVPWLVAPIAKRAGFDVSCAGAAWDGRRAAMASLSTVPAEQSTNAP